MNALLDVFLSFLCAFFGTCDNQACRLVDHARVQHIVCTYAVNDVVVKTHLNDAKGVPYASLSRLENVLASDPKSAKPIMVMNGGMYHRDLSAVGLYVEKSKQKKSISTKGGWGNFHLLPNGVFWVKDGKIGVTETTSFIRRKIAVDYATQSGPMLVINGKLHPRFLKDSDSRKIRNGVGISRDGKTLFFALSNRAVTFWDFGQLFQKKLKAHNALFLDGTVSAIRTEKFRQGGWRDLGPMIAVSKK